MKAQCDRCKEIVPLEFAVESAAIRVRCPACAAEYTVEATVTTAPRRREPPPSLSAPRVAVDGEMTCPKCGEVQRKAAACRRCGLIIARWKPDSVSAEPVLGDAREAAELWKQVEASWSDGALHEAFIDHCRKAGALAYAAARYRQSSSRPGAADRLAQVRVVAEHSLAAVPRAAPVKRSNVRTVALAAVVAILLVLIWVLISSAFDAPRH